MNQLKSHLQNACRTMLRPLARGVRWALTPSEPPVEFDWHRIDGGAAAGAEVLLPQETPIAESHHDG